MENIVVKLLENHSFSLQELRSAVILVNLASVTISNLTNSHHVEVMNGSPYASGLHYRGRGWMWESVRPLCPCPPQMTRKRCPRKPASPPPASAFHRRHPSRLIYSLNALSGQKQMSFCK